ncbi:hypothetical protein [Streptomyces achromogenes]
MSGYGFLAAVLLFALYGWRSPASDMRFLARLSLLMAVLMAVDLWWAL